MYTVTIQQVLAFECNTLNAQGIIVDKVNELYSSYVKQIGEERVTSNIKDVKVTPLDRSEATGSFNIFVTVIVEIEIND